MNPKTPSGRMDKVRDNVRTALKDDLVEIALELVDNVEGLTADRFDLRREIDRLRADLDDARLRAARAEADVETLGESLSLERARVNALTGARVQGYASRSGMTEWNIDTTHTDPDEIVAALVRHLGDLR